MSSYELLELLEFMPDRGAFKTAARGGEYSDEEIVWRHIATELSKLRSITQTVHGGKANQMMTFPTIAEQRERAEEAADMEERRELLYSFADRTPLPRSEKFDWEDS
jgi:hypothetical protein